MVPESWKKFNKNDLKISNDKIIDASQFNRQTKTTDTNRYNNLFRLTQELTQIAMRGTEKKYTDKLRQLEIIEQKWNQYFT